jgi:hypothetical protein
MRASGWTGQRSALGKANLRLNYVLVRAFCSTSTRTAIVSPRLILANVMSRRGKLRAITARFSDDGKGSALFEVGEAWREQEADQIL